MSYAVASTNGAYEIYNPELETRNPEPGFSPGQVAGR
jgi:hypothetical protein